MDSLSKDELILVITILLIFFAGILGLILREKRSVQFLSYGEKILSSSDIFKNRAYFKHFKEVDDSLSIDSLRETDNSIISDTISNQNTYVLRININTAGAGEFEKLPGIGPVIARRIVEYREEHGPFLRTSDLQKVRGIGPAKFSKIENLITM